MSLFYLALAVLPFLLFCILLFNYSASLLKISLITLCITVLIVLIFWQSPVSIVAFSLGRGSLIALDILAIIFGAILFLDILKKIKITDSLACHLDTLSRDLRVQVILLAWFLENFLEGIAGFGTPSTVAAPLLIILGVSPVKAVIISLLGNSISVPFGAVGTPVRTGFAGIDISFSTLAPIASAYNLVGLLVPVFMLFVLVSGAKDSKKLFLHGLPFALWSGISYVVAALFVSLFGIEFPSIFGSILGLIMVIIPLKLHLFNLGDEFRIILRSKNTVKMLPLFSTIFPYFLFITLLVAAKILLSKVAFSIPVFQYSIALFNPGIVFLVVSLIVASYSKMRYIDIFPLIRNSAVKSINPFLVIAAMSSVVQLMNYSSQNPVNLPSITATFSALFTTPILGFAAPFIGALGSFITGSATVSNIMFGPSLHLASLQLGLDPIKILSLALVGAGAGNMVALSDVLVAQTVVGAPISLRNLIIKILPYCLVVLVLMSFLGILT